MSVTPIPNFKPYAYDDVGVRKSNLVLLLNAERIAGSDGDTIEQFLDFSGFARHASQSNASIRPVLKTGSNGINGKKVLRFSGGQLMVNTTLPAFGTGQWTAFMVIRRTVNSDSYATYFSIGRPLYNAIFTVTPSYNHLLNAAGSGSNQITDGSSVLNEAELIIGRSNGSGTYYVYKNGTSEQSNSPPINCSSGYLLGDWTDTGNPDQPFYGDIAFVAVYDKSLSSSEVTSIANAITTYYGL